MKKFENLEANVIEWANDKNLITKNNSMKQYAKVLEETQEILVALNNDNKDELIDAIGDTLVTLIILSKQNNLNIVDCLHSAYNVIKDRTGKTVNGTFIKD
jgi:phosphoribosyl-ATP pyrophosphohydrolase